MSPVIKIIIVAIVWMLGGGAVGGMTAVLFAMGALGGIHTPPAWWWAVVSFGAFAMPLLLMFGWIPTAVQIKRDKPAWKTALLTLAVLGVAWLCTMIAWEVGRPKA